MKKTLLTIAITLGLTIGATAQSDGFFNSYSVDDGSRSESQDLPTLPQGGQIGDCPAPLGTGLLILTALGAGYAVAKRRDER